MESLKLFGNHAPNRTFVAILFGALSGALYALLIPVVMKAVFSDPGGFVIKDKQVEVLGLEVAHSKFALLFLSLCTLILIFKTLSEVWLCRIALDIRFQLRRDLYRRIRDTPIASLEKIGEARLVTALTGDISSIVLGAQLLPELLSSSVVIFAMLGYLACIDLHAVIYVVETIIFGIATYQLPVVFGMAKFKKARNRGDILQESFKGLIAGAKELKLSSNKRLVFERDFLVNVEDQMRGLEKGGRTIFSIANNYGSLMTFFAIGGVAFVLVNYRAFRPEDLLAAIMVLLYVTGPIAVLLNVSPVLVQMHIALRRVKSLYADLPSEGFSENVTCERYWKTLSLTNVIFKYVEFQVGPINLEIQRGSILFITGGNGSGKSTLAKMISQHYLPTSGEIRTDEHLIDADTIAGFRNEISCIYTDYYLFRRLLISPELIEEVESYLRAFDLAAKVQIRDGGFTTLRLSDGQRKRLALALAMAEQKTLYVFDEWAADQDPRFQRTFYQQILPALKHKNCAVIVISHDERFFSVADRIITMESGRVASDRLGLSTS
jgi:putative ATP-binding cassette transporter